MKRKTLTEEEIINAWLVPAYGITVQEVKKAHPRLSSKGFYAKYPVTKEQHDTWRLWLLKKLMWYQGLGKRYAERSMWATYLNTAPLKKKEKK